MTAPNTAAAIAANRFGLGARPGELPGIGVDAADWLLRQLKGAPPVLKGEGLKPSAETLAKVIELRKQVLAERRENKKGAGESEEKVATALKLPAVYRPVYIDEVHARFAHSVTTERPFLELHTLGVDGGYTQADVTTFAQAISGWSIGGQDNGRRLAIKVPGTVS